MIWVLTCSMCDGHGKMEDPEEVCPDCNGKGKVRSRSFGPGPFAGAGAMAAAPLAAPLMASATPKIRMDPMIKLPEIPEIKISSKQQKILDDHDQLLRKIRDQIMSSMRLGV